MEEFLSYFSSAGLSMNPSKSELILFRRGRQEQELTVNGQPEAKKIRLLGVNVEKGYVFDAHAKQIAATVKTKVEKLSEVLKLLDYKKRKNVTEAIVISTLSYCLAVWGFRKKCRTRCQKSMNHAIRMVLQKDNRYSITEGLSVLEWANMDNLWRLEMITATRRILETRIPDTIYSIFTGRTGGRYLIRSDGVRSSWWPRNTHGDNAFVNRSVEVFNEMRIAQRVWMHDRENRALTKSEVRNTIKHELIRQYGNENLY